MKAPFTIKIRGKIKHTSNNMPGKYDRNILLNIPFGVTRKLIVHNKISMYIQSYSTKEFWIETYSINAKIETTLDCIVVKPHIGFHHQLSGNIICQLQGDKVPFVFQQKHHAAAFIPSGKHKITFRPGQYIYFFFVLKSTYYKRLSKEYPVLIPLVKSLNENSYHLEILQTCRIDSGVIKLIKQLEQCNKTGIALDTSILSIIQDFIAKYTEQINTGISIPNKTTPEIIQEVKEYIISTVAKGPRQSIDAIASKHYISPKTLTREFSKTFGLSIKKYKIQERMKVAKNMLKQGSSIQELANQLGYSTVFNFRRAYYKHFSHWPEERKK
ncbi:helix-turn-helix domain-containing protein [Chitinophaga sp. Hz27]|uniref:helix-turn-helix domain-containing protein n=1 Tax=Chitinophaga sp. Hz27 TaxID=3347169 RepID=UPI0035E36431